MLQYSWASKAHGLIYEPEREKIRVPPYFRESMKSIADDLDKIDRRVVDIKDKIEKFLKERRDNEEINRSKKKEGSL